MSATPSIPSQENASILENVQVKIEKGSPELNPHSIPLPDPLIPVTSIKVEVDSMKKSDGNDASNQKLKSNDSSKKPSASDQKSSRGSSDQNRTSKRETSSSSAKQPSSKHQLERDMSKRVDSLNVEMSDGFAEEKRLLQIQIEELKKEIEAEKSSLEQMAFDQSGKSSTRTDDKQPPAEIKSSKRSRSRSPHSRTDRKRSSREPQFPQRPTNRMVVCVRKLPSNAIKTEVKDLFSKYGEISEFESKDDQVYVLFKRHSDAVKANEELSCNYSYRAHILTSEMVSMTELTKRWPRCLDCKSVHLFKKCSVSGSKSSDKARSRGSSPRQIRSSRSPGSRRPRRSKSPATAAIRNPSPIRSRRSRSPRKPRSPACQTRSPVSSRTRSPVRPRRSRSPIRARRSRSPLHSRRSQSPPRRPRSPARRSRSPRPRRSRSPTSRRSRSPVRVRRSKSPASRRRSTSRHHSKSPINHHSTSRHRSKSPISIHHAGSHNKSRSPSLLHKPPNPPRKNRETAVLSPVSPDPLPTYRALRISPDEEVVYKGCHPVSPPQPALYRSCHPVSPPQPALYKSCRSVSPDQPVLYDSPTNASSRPPLPSVSKFLSKRKGSPSPMRMNSRSRSPVRSRRERSSSFELVWPRSPIHPAAGWKCRKSISPLSHELAVKVERGYKTLLPARGMHKSNPGPAFHLLKPVLQAKRETLRQSRMNISSGYDWGERALDSFEIVSAIGKGAYGQIYKAVDKDTNSLVALKTIKLDANQGGFPFNFLHEMKLLGSLDHPNIIKLLEIVAESQENVHPIRGADFFYFVFDYISHDLNGLLQSKLVQLKPDDIAWILKQVLDAVGYCHRLGLIHMDLKCSNILINNRGQVKLTQFGLSCFVDQDGSTCLGPNKSSIVCRAPELLLGATKYEPSVDIWSCGCILGEMFSQKPIFLGKDDMQQLEVISMVCGSPTPLVWPDVALLPLYYSIKTKAQHDRRLNDAFYFIPYKARDLLDKLLTLDPSKRPSAVAALENDWLKDVDPLHVSLAVFPKSQDCHALIKTKASPMPVIADPMPAMHQMQYGAMEAKGRLINDNHSRSVDDRELYRAPREMPASNAARFHDTSAMSVGNPIKQPVGETFQLDKPGFPVDTNSASRKASFLRVKDYGFQPVKESKPEKPDISKSVYESLLEKLRGAGDARGPRHDDIDQRPDGKSSKDRAYSSDVRGDDGQGQSRIRIMPISSQQTGFPEDNLKSAQFDRQKDWDGTEYRSAPSAANVYQEARETGYPPHYRPHTAGNPNEYHQYQQPSTGHQPSYLPGKSEVGTSSSYNPSTATSSHAPSGESEDSKLPAWLATVLKAQSFLSKSSDWKNSPSGN